MERNRETWSVTHQDKQGVSLFRVTENMDGVIRVDACTHVYIQKANQFCFSCFAVLSCSHSHYLNAKEHLMIGEIFFDSSEF